MSEVTRVLQQIESGDPSAAAELLPLIYAELRRLAVQKMSQEKSGQTLQATALVHEAYLRLVDQTRKWDSRGHFFVAAAEAMRRILVDRARERNSLKRGGGLVRAPFDQVELPAPRPEIDLLELDEALSRLAAKDADAARLVELRYFAGLTSAEAAEAMSLAERSAERLWAYARSFLFKELGGQA